MLHAHVTQLEENCIVNQRAVTRIMQAQSTSKVGLRNYKYSLAVFYGDKCKSGPAWCDQFPTSIKIDDLGQPFRDNLRRFVNALLAAGASVIVRATYRPPQRAYLMHYAWRISRERFDPRIVPRMYGLEIDWAHRDPRGGVRLILARRAAEAMVRKYRIVYPPLLISKHSSGCAIDMQVTWKNLDQLCILDANGVTVQIEGMPKNGNNRQLHLVSATYGVMKLLDDPPHWSDDGT